MHSYFQTTQEVARILERHINLHVALAQAASLLKLRCSKQEAILVTRIAATSKSQVTSDCNRNSKKSPRLRKHPLKPTLWTREPPVVCCFYSVSEAPCESGSPPEYVATTRVWFWIAAIFLAQWDFYDCGTAILLRFLRGKLATSKLWLPIASDLWLRLRGSLRKRSSRVQNMTTAVRTRYAIPLGRHCSIPKCLPCPSTLHELQEATQGSIPSSWTSYRGPVLSYFI